MIITLEFDFGTVAVYDDYIIVVMNSGVHVSPDLSSVLEDIVFSYFYDKSFVYLSHRKNSYSVDPSIYFEVAEIENLAGFGVIAEVPVASGNAEIEKLFLNKPFEIFSDLDTAIMWAKDLIKNE